MILYPRSDKNSDDERLDRLCDPDLARRLRKNNPKFFTQAGYGSIAKILALAGIVSLVSGFVIEPVVFAPHREAAPPIVTRAHTVPPVLQHVQAHHAAAPPALHVKAVSIVAPKPVAPAVEPVPAPQPKPNVRHRTRVLAVTEAQAQSQNEERFWLNAQARARAQDREAAAKAAAVAAAAAPVQAPQQEEDTQQAQAPQPPVSSPRVPSPVANPYPTLPGGGPCTPGRGPILVGGHGLGGMIINAVLQNVIIHHRPPGRP